MKPSWRENLNHFILHVGTNDLNKEISPELIGKSIVDLAIMLKGNSCDVSVSNIIVRGDNSNLNEKGYEINAHLTEMCKERKLNLINHSKKIKPNHLNWGKLHLNQKRSKVLRDAFSKEISNVFNWHYSVEDSRLDHEGWKSKFSLEEKNRADAKTILKSIRPENTTHLEISFNYLSTKLRETSMF